LYSRAVIPAKAHRCPGKIWIPWRVTKTQDFRLQIQYYRFVIPAKAGIQRLSRFASRWIPAFAGMTEYLAFLQDRQILSPDSNAPSRE
jgi:hypothetical protein